MNKLDFNIDRSKTQYDIYKYKLGSKISYSKRKIYRYTVNGIVYNLRTEPRFKYLYKLEVSTEVWNEFILNDWEHKLYELNLYKTIISHINGITSFNKFNSIKLPDDLSMDIHDYESSDIELIVDWFRDEKFKPTSDQLYLVIFNR